MPLVATHELDQSKTHPANKQIYCALDSMLTHEIYSELNTLFNEVPITYKFERALQGPLVEIMLRGFLVDEFERQKSIKELEGTLASLQGKLNRLAQAIWDQDLNPNSPKQLQEFFYGKMQLPEQMVSNKGKKRVSTNREALEKLEVYFYARPLVALILAIRDVNKTLGVLRTEVDEDGRLRTSYNIGGTETGRLSSSASSLGTGTNLQNLRKDVDEGASASVSIRKVFIADPGWKLCGIDLEQTESHDVGWLHGIIFDDWRYLDAVQAGDVHTYVCKMIWRELPWTGDRKADRKIADQTFYRNFSYRDMAKRGGHACLTPDHEVLTKKGWVKISEKPSEIMTWSPHKSCFDTVLNWYEGDYCGEMHEFTGNSISVLMTPEHRVPYKTSSAATSPLKVRQAKDGPGATMPLGDNYVGGTISVAARLIAAFMSDGTQKSTNTMEFHLKKPHKVERLKKLCDMYGYVWEEQKGDKFIVKGALPKNPGEFMFDWTSNCLDEFLDEYKYWDGHISKTAISLHSTKRKNLEWIQTFGRLRGIGGSIQKPQISGFGSTCYSLQQNKRTYAAGKSVKHATCFMQTKIYCPTVASSFFYIRRNGKISVTGNSNYMVTPFTMARHLKIPLKYAEHFQESYYGAFPAFRQWFRWTAEQLQTTQHLVTPFGRSRHFFGRPNDDATLREAIAFVPQSTTADRMNLGLWRLWRYGQGRIQCLAQVHDAVYFQYRPEDEQEVVPWALEQIKVKMHHEASGRTMIVPGEAKIGWNWGNYHERTNPDGLTKFNLAKPDQRERTPILRRQL